MYPAMLNITEKKVTIIGGGKVAYRKAIAFLKFGAKVYVFAPNFYEAFDTIQEDITLEKTKIEKVDLAEKLRKSFIVVAATDKSQLNEAIGIYCQEEGILCNVIDNIHLSSFIVPAYMKRGDLIISISTNGKSPSLTKKIKRQLETFYDDSYEEYVDRLGRIREKVLIEIQEDEEKQAILKHIITLNLEELRDYEKSYFSH